MHDDDFQYCSQEDFQYCSVRCTFTSHTSFSFILSVRPKHWEHLHDENLLLILRQCQQQTLR